MTNRPLNKVSLKWGMVEEPGLSIIDRFLLLADLGFDGVELDAPNDLPLAEIIAARDRSGLAIPGVINSVHWKAPLTDPDPEVRRRCLQSIRTALDNAREYGASTMLIVPGVVNAATSYAQAYERATVELSKVLEHADKTGVSIAVENVWNDFLLSPLEAARFVDGFNHPRIGWYFDVGNVLRYGRPAHWIEALGKRILKIDVKEFSLERMNTLGPWKGFDMELGEGDCDWAAVNQALRLVGYSGWASIEVPGGDRHRLRDLKARFDRLAAL
ncbi:sugar phosphate isomerase/epimerase family protein [Devosia sp. SL43]|uniref:sugar phosphate isomerase/epimerase family protein n=1 Tax=Devosia sp. SL43 TaxID=2806348 RepID=UPI001F43134E|nr:sugar phosphate isomerase/epimerase family protein [Devosia sp. SL43]